MAGLGALVKYEILLLLEGMLIVVAFVPKYRTVVRDWRTYAAAGVALADIGIAAVGTLLAAMATVTRARELLLPLLFLPLAMPIVVGGVGASIADDPARYLGFLVLYDVVFAIISWASFEYVVSD